MTRTGYLGPAGTHSHEAAGAGPGAVPFATIPEVVAAVARGEIDRGLVPLENSTEGGVGATLDALVDTADVEITGEVVHPVSYALIARTALALEEVRSVASHPQALAQCARFLRTRVAGAQIVPASSTAEAVRTLAGEGTAALASPAAAELYGATVLEAGVEDEPGNATRFVWIERTGARDKLPAGAAKTSIVWWGAGDESPGWLVRCLSEFAFRGVNLSRIESRPHRQALGHYRFFVDLDGGRDDTPVAEAIAALANHAESVRVLGSYPAAPASPDRH